MERSDRRRTPQQEINDALRETDDAMRHLREMQKHLGRAQRNADNPAVAYQAQNSLAIAEGLIQTAKENVRNLVRLCEIEQAKELASN